MTAQELFTHTLPRDVNEPAEAVFKRSRRPTRLT
jgi:hypothetical protein